MPTTSSPTSLTSAPPELLHPLRTEVALLRHHEQRRWFPASLWVGEPAADRLAEVELSWPLPRWYDDGLLHDLVAALLEPASHGDVIGLSRPGHPDPHDVDVRVAAALSRAADAAGSDEPPLVVVTRYGWLHPASGDRRRWRRLRLDEV